jgi:hypothetical protein
VTRAYARAWSEGRGVQLVSAGAAAMGVVKVERAGSEERVKVSCRVLCAHSESVI